MLIVLDATTVTPPTIADKSAIGVRSTSIFTALLVKSQTELPVVLTVLLLKKVSVDKSVVGV